MNVWILKTFADWACGFLCTTPPFVGIDLEGAETCPSWTMRRYFELFYEEMAIGDIVVLGTGSDDYEIRAILRITGNPVTAENSPRHRRKVEIIWQGEPVETKEWKDTQGLARVDTAGGIKKLIELYANLN